MTSQAALEEMPVEARFPSRALFGRALISQPEISASAVSVIVVDAPQAVRDQCVSKALGQMMLNGSAQRIYPI